MKREKEIKANPNIDFSKCNVEKFYATLVRILEEKYDGKIKYSVRKKTPEEMIEFPEK